MNSTSILVTGDLVVNRTFDVANIDKPIIDLFKKSALNIVNLEAPVTTSKEKILKTGPWLNADETNTKYILNALNVDVVTLANNHILDYGSKGISDTLSFCANQKVKCVGAGMTLDEASRTLYLEVDQGKIAIVNFAENEWASASEESAGANPMNIINNARQISEAKSHSDYVFVIVHGGHEYYNLPSPRMQKQYRFYIDQGADIVIGHHTHCLNGYEQYNGKPIYYSLGNFLFTKPSIYEDWYTGLILEIEIADSRLITGLQPVKQQKNSYGLELVTGRDKEAILSRILSYNEIIANPYKLKEAWASYVDSKYHKYLNYWSPLSFINNRFIKAAFLKLGIKPTNKKGMALFLNLMRCEAHADISKEVTKKYLSS